MDALIAVNTIERAVKPGENTPDGKVARKVEKQTIKPGTKFVPADAKEREFLLASGAARAPEKDEAKDDRDVVEAPTKGKSNNPKPSKKVEDMSIPEMEAHIQRSSLTPPADWNQMKVDDKRAWLTKAETGQDLV